ncbi:arginase family protein [Mycobacterium sp. BMJ-28]
MIDLIVSTGRVADRVDGLGLGALLTGQALERRYGVEARFVGVNAQIEQDDWEKSLPAAATTLSAVQEEVKRSLSVPDRTTLMVASTCPTSLASLPVVAQQIPDVTVLWIDGHADFNTPNTTESGYLGGMVLAAACGLWDSGYGAGISPSRVIVAGARDIDPAEKVLLASAGVSVLGPAEATPDAIRELTGSSDVWIHIDWDVLEPGYIPAEYALPNGLVPVQVREILECIPPKQVRGLELAEFLPPANETVRTHALETILRTIEPITLGSNLVTAEAG